MINNISTEWVTLIFIQSTEWGVGECVMKFLFEEEEYL